MGRKTGRDAGKCSPEGGKPPRAWAESRHFVLTSGEVNDLCTAFERACDAGGSPLTDQQNYRIRGVFLRMQEGDRFADLWDDAPEGAEYAAGEEPLESLAAVAIETGEGGCDDSS
jgi:hypothetical protein